MAVLKKEDLIKKLTDFLGESPDDKGVELLEDVTDTVNAGTGDGEDWKKKYEDNDKAWRKKYIDRFNGTSSDKDDIPDDDGDDNKTPPTYDSLFKNTKE